MSGDDCNRTPSTPDNDASIVVPPAKASRSKVVKVNLCDASLILLDEFPTTSVSNYDAIDLMLRELMENDLPFGSKVVLALGDFNQMPPVVPKAEP